MLMFLLQGFGEKKRSRTPTMPGMSKWLDKANEFGKENKQSLKECEEAAPKAG